MKAEHWPAVERLYAAALERPPEERAAFLCEACGGDEELRSEVESLLAYQDRAKDFIETPALQIAGELMANGQSLVAGQSLNHYTILELLGAGGMGEVYLAEDTRLKRRVALKLLPAEMTANRDRLLRFEQEARAASALNHPNILTIYEIGQAESTHFISTEYVEGDTLRLLLSSPMKLDEVLEICIQVASALAAAHAADIIHRDIKPENIMLRRDGIVKVLDFGLAKLLAPQSTEIDTRGSTRFKTSAGVVMGTASYMSPEQARGLAVDGRTDIWSLGAMLYELATSRQPFDGKTPSDVIALILQKEPLPLTHFSPEVPTELERIVRKALHKEREQRYQTIKDLLIDLRNLRKELELSAEMERSAPPLISKSGSRDQSTAAIAHSTSSAKYIVSKIKQHKRAAALVLGIVVIVSAGLLYVFSRRSQLLKQAAVPTTFKQLTDQLGPEYFPSLSPDGKSFVYAGFATGNWDIYYQRVGGRNPINLTADSPADDTQPAFSPDGERISFRSSREGGGIFVMGATGESVKRLTDVGSNPVWSPDGKEIAFADEAVLRPFQRNNPNSRIWAVNVATGEKRPLTKVDSVQPNWSPHGYRIAFLGRLINGQRDIWTIPAGEGESVEVTNDAFVDWNPVWSPDGNCLYFVSDRGGSMNLWRVPIEEKTGKVLGPPEAITTPSSYIAHLSFSRDGHQMAYTNQVSRSNLQQVGFDPVRETVIGQPVWITQGSLQALSPQLSPDGESLTFWTVERQEDIFIVKRDGTGLRQLTDDSYLDRGPRWSPDGERIAFQSDRSGRWEIWMINADGSGLQQVTYASGQVTDPAWSPDGTRLAYRNRPYNSAIIEVGKSWQEQTPQTLPSMGDSRVRLYLWSWSEDGRKLAGHNEYDKFPSSGVVVYSLDSQQYEKLTDFGTFPVWLSDSRRLLFQDQNKLFLIDCQSKKIHEVLTVGPNELVDRVTLPRDNRLIYFSHRSTEADIWLMTLN